ncbi:hypothetical protein FPOAC1_012196 [Fusarium poae]|uniref:hypothetical protein n=1 Tax=Fusarium poae TaxID=36050 RepID=UPI001CE7B0B0|nr:hypothetical protein FPOAC1_012196 [Fusarium poae]KAG8667368.1 hypothetical protein FPOAC1_012196 [Fusarium poae]
MGPDKSLPALLAALLLRPLWLLNDVCFQETRMQKDVHKSLIDAKRVAVFECKPNKDKDEEARDNSEAKDTY